MIIVLWGVSGCGKTTIGRRLARALGCPFYDADDFHPESNVEKLRSGIPLSDADREPWLATLAKLVCEKASTSTGAVLACSALKRRYRQALSVPGVDIRFVQLAGTFNLVERRLREREHAFMNPVLLQSQFDILEPDPSGWVIDVSADPPSIVASLVDKLTKR